MSGSTKTRKRVPKTKEYRLDLACGQSKQDGFTGVDIWDGADIVHDLTQYPWPFPDSSVKEVHCSHYVEHVPLDVLYDGKLTDGLCAFMNELHRVCKPDAKVVIRHPYLMSSRAFQDPTHRRFIPETTWYYFDENWRVENKLDHYPITANFEVVIIQGDGVNPDVQTRNLEYQTFARGFYWHVLSDLVVELKARK